MAPKDGSPSASSTFLPLAKQLRRASVTSITSLFDKQSLNQTLDQIHSSASQSETLTTFNDYTSPPPSTAIQKKPPDAAGGIGSWYTRMTSSVTSTKGNKSAPESVPRASTARSGEAATTPSETNGASSTRDRASTNTSAAQTDVLADSHTSLRAPSRRSQYSQTAESKSVVGSVDGKGLVENSRPATPTASHRPGHSVSSQISASQVSSVSVNESRSEQRQPPASLKRTMTPEPSAPASPLLQDLERSRASLSLLPGKSISRTPSVSSSTSTRRIGPNDSRRESARPAASGPETSPTLSRFASVSAPRMDREEGDSAEANNGTGNGDASKSEKPERPGLPRVSTNDAATELRRIQAQGFGAAASNRAQIQTVGATLTQLKNKVLSRQYWMKDENAKDCFYCGDPFSTFRRKHHCRTCGQIFDAKCTSLISGVMFGQSGNIRVCKPCEGLINGYDDSSDYTDDDTASIMTNRTKYRHGSKGAGDTSPVRPSTPASKMGDSGLRGVRSNLNTFKSHLPSVLGRRVIDDLKRTSGQYDDDSDRRSIRPASSRSLKSSYGMRPHTGHRRYHSKHLLQRSSRGIAEEKAPFYRGPDTSSSANDRLPAFHSDNVIDPDLAAYLSDDAETDDEEQSLAAALAGSGRDQSDGQGAVHNPELKRPRSRYGDSLKIITGSQIDTDAMSISSSKVATPLRHLRRRNVSFTGSVYQTSPPKPQRLSVAAQQWSSPSLDGIAASFPGRPESVHMTRSISMQGPRAPPVELNNASMQHGRRLLRQMLEENSVRNVAQWEKALMPIFLRATDDVVPNVQAGDAINITNYVKLKKVPGGKPDDTSYISGVVFSKNVALKSMKRNIPNPNILIITFALEYSRHETHFMSLEPVIRQEREYLQNLVNRIAALKPELLLVQRNVSGLALEMLDKAKIATAYNVKRSVLEAISRCCQTRIVTSLDKLASQLDSHSACESFYLKTFLHEQRRKTYMYLSGCPRELGCTIVLRGGSTSTLRRVKRVAEFMLQAIYNLRLETSLMRDEFALIPHYGAEGTIRYEAHLIAKHEVQLPPTGDDSRPTTANGSTDGLLMAPPDKRASSSLGITTAEDDRAVDVFRSRPPANTGQSDLPDDIPAPTFYSDLVDEQRTRILSTSPFVKFMQPYLLMRARESERRLMHLKRLLDQDVHDLSLPDDSKPRKFSLITPEMINETVQETSRKIREIIHAVHESEYDKATHTYQTQTKQWEASVSGNADMFNPLSHQSITVLHSLISTTTNIACSGPDVFTIRFYDDRGVEDGPEADCTLGQYVEDTCLSAGEQCHIHGCNKRMHEHHRHYVHGEGRLEVTIERLPPKAPGLDAIPLMWSVCRVCSKETQAVPISPNTWNYSFGKYLELAFWSIPLKPRADICPHDLHHDHWRYFGYKNWAIRLQYDPIDILEVLVPRTRITWNVVNDLKFKNENFRKAERRLSKFVASVRARLKSIRLDTLLPEKVDQCKEEIERLTQKITDDHQKVLEKLQEKYEGSRFYEIVPFNRALRMLHEMAGEWDEIFADFADSFLPSEKDIKRLATIQVKKLLFGNEESGTGLTSDETANTSFTDDANGEHSPDGMTGSLDGTQVVSEKTQEVMEAFVEEGAKDAQQAIELQQTEKQTAANDQLETKVVADADDPLVQHLDLAVSSPTSPKALRKSPALPLELSSQPSSDESSPERATLPNLVQTVSEGAALTPIMSEENSSEGEKAKASNIPRLAEHSRRKSIGAVNVPSQRSQSQPAHIRQLTAIEARAIGIPVMTPASPTSAANPANQDSLESSKPQRRLSQRLAVLRNGGQSKIPRSANSNRKDNRVSALAKHFEQLISREFQQERLRDKKKKAGRQRHAGAYPAAALRPVVEVYHDVREAVHGGQAESLPSTQEEDKSAEQEYKVDRSASEAEALAADLVNATKGDGFHAPGSRTQQQDQDEIQHSQPDATITEAKDEADKVDDELSSPTQPSFDGTDEPLAEEDVDDLDLDVTRHEKTSIIKMLTNFWAERSASSWEFLYYPLRDIDHVFANSDIIVREDEPSSLIALALDHSGYRDQLKSIEEISTKKSPLSKRAYVEDLFLSAEEQRSIERSLLENTGHHLNYAFERGPAKMQCKIFWAEQFEAVRKKCGVSERIIESLSRCLKWDSQGGKSKSIFLRTLDDRFVLKSLSQAETRSFTSFASSYFDLMGEALFHELPSLIAKMLGFYYIRIQDPVSGIYFDEYLLLMENLFYARAPNPIFDLKGAMRNRKKNVSGEQNEVLLDENMVDYIAENPLFAREHSKKLLRSSIYNDTLFLSKQNVMDYSLMLGIDGDTRELVVGIIDCIRKYTWDKKLETWVKDRGKNRPTVTEPKDYKNRFREAINRYVMQTPDCWHFGLAQNLGFSNARTEVQMLEREDDVGPTGENIDEI